MTESKSEYKPHSHAPYGADGSGFYSDNTIGCFNVMKAASPLMMKGVEAVPYDGKNAFVICDYGTADGGTSMFLIKDVCAELKKKHGKATPIHVVYEDQPINDFKSLFLRIQGLIPGPPSYLKENDEIYVTACGTSFYSQCLPGGTVHLGFSASAIHWLMKRPCRIPDGIHHTSLTGDKEKATFAAQAEEDWNTFLLHRAKELSQGGQMVIVGFSIDSKGQYLGYTKNVKHSMLERMTSLWKKMVTLGKITQEEFDNTNINNYYRTEEEFKAPFQDPNSPIMKAGLRLVSIEMKHLKCVYLDKWINDGKKGDVEAARKHAKWYIPTTRTWSNSSFLSGLSDKRTPEEKAKIVDEFFQMYEDEVAAAPEDHGMDYIQAFIHLKKV